MNLIKKIIYQLSHPFIRVYWKIIQPTTFGSKGFVVYNDEILLIKNIPVDYWMLPGGKIDQGENPEQCIIRELKEELSLNIEKPDYLLGTYTSQNEGKKDTIFVFVIKILSKDFTQQWEIKDAQWFHLNNLPENLSPATQRRINEFKNNRKNITENW